MSKVRLGFIHLILIAYLIITIIIRPLMPSTYSLIINPLFWIGLCLIIKFTNNDNFNRVGKENREYIQKILIVMLAYVIIYCFLGLVFGFSRSPYSHNLIPLLKNIFQYIVAVYAIEYVRSITVNANYKNKSIIIFTLILFILINTNIPTFFDMLKNNQSMFKYFFGTLLPFICNESLCTYLVYKGNFKVSFSYLAINRLILILLPVYPSLDWFGNGILGIVLPIVTYMYAKTTTKKKEKRRNKDNPVTLIIAIIFALTFGAFMMRLFKYEPLAILSNSMYPFYERGDVLVICKPDKNNLKNLDKNNIIVYRIENQLVAHRIIDVIENDGEILYQTQGDNNNAPDIDLVGQDQIVGIYTFHVKYIGYPSVYLNDLFNNEKAKVEIK